MRSASKVRHPLWIAVAAGAVVLAALGVMLTTRPEPTRSAPERLRPLGEYLEGDAPWAELGPDALPTPRVDRAAEAAAAAQLPEPSGYALGFDHYATPAQINTFLRQLESDYPDLLQVFTIGWSWQGREILAVRVTNETLPQPPADRPAMYTDGQHHARELISAAVPLYTLWTLVSGYGKDPLLTYLVDTRAAYFVPSVNVDGNQLVLVDNQAWRKTANPTCCDDDGDGRVDEDAPLGFGYGTFGVDRYVFDAHWANDHPGNPFVDDWQPHLAGRPEVDLGRFTGTFGGPMRALLRIDADGDGAREEDPIGGTDPNRNYDVLWDRGEPKVYSEVYRGPTVWSEPETRAVRDFVSSLDRLAVAVSYHSGIDLLLHPWGYSATEPLPDESAYELIGAKGSELTEVNGYHGSPHTWTARGLYGAFGSTMDWLYKIRGAYAFSPETYGGDDTVFIERIGVTGAFTVAKSLAVAFNPNPDRILPVVDRWTRFATYLLAATPNIELNDIGLEGGDLVVTLGNDGVLPADVLLTVTEPQTGRTVFETTAPVRLAANQHTFRVGVGGRDRGDLVLTARVDSAIGTVPHEVEVARWTVALDGGSGALKDGARVPFRDLGASFGGWWADERFHGRDYTCRPDVRNCPPPLVFTPPPTPTLGPTQTPPALPTRAWPSPLPRQTRTPWSVEAPPWWPKESSTPTATRTAEATPTPTETPTATRRAAVTLYLPVARRDE